MKWSYAEYERDIVAVAKAFIKLGLRPQHSVAILGELQNYSNDVEYLLHCPPGHNAPEWHISNMAAVVAGGLACGVYTTSSAAAVEYKLQHGRADILVLEDAEQLDKVTMGIYYCFYSSYLDPGERGQAAAAAGGGAVLGRGRGGVRRDDLGPAAGARQRPAGGRAAGEAGAAGRQHGLHARLHIRHHRSASELPNFKLLLLRNLICRQSEGSFAVPRQHHVDHPGQPERVQLEHRQRGRGLLPPAQPHRGADHRHLPLLLRRRHRLVRGQDSAPGEVFLLVL